MMQFHNTIFLYLLFCCSPAFASEKIYTVAVVPQFTSAKVHQDWSPLLSKLGQLTGFQFKLFTYNEFPRFERAMNQGVPDLIFLNPYHMVVAKRKQNYRPLVRDSNPISGIVVVRNDSPIKSLSELSGKTIAYPSPNALGASLYIRALLTEKIHIKTTPLYVGSHHNVYRHVLIGEVPAGGGVTTTLEKETEDIRSKLRIIFTTPNLSPHPLAAHPRLPEVDSKIIVAALFAIKNDIETSKLLAAVQMPQLIEANYARDYAGLTNLKLDKYAEIETP